MPPPCQPLDIVWRALLSPHRLCNMGIYHCGHPDDAAIRSYWWQRYSSLACMPTPEIAWALPCSACGEHLANLLCQRRQWIYMMSLGRTSMLPVALPQFGYVALCLMSPFFSSTNMHIGSRGSASCWGRSVMSCFRIIAFTPALQAAFNCASRESSSHFTLSSWWASTWQYFLLKVSPPVVNRLDMYRTKVLMYRTMVLMARPTKVRR